MYSAPGTGSLTCAYYTTIFLVKSNNLCRKTGNGLFRIPPHGWNTKVYPGINCFPWIFHRLIRPKRQGPGTVFTAMAERAMSRFGIGDTGYHRAPSKRPD